MAKKNNIKILLAVPESDCHCVVNQLLNHSLKEIGCSVINLGTNTRKSSIARAMYKYKPDFVLITCQNGHALQDLQGLSKQLEKYNVSSMPIWIGGKLTTRGILSKAEIMGLYQEGITRIFPNHSKLENLVIEFAFSEQKYAA